MNSLQPGRSYLFTGDDEELNSFLDNFSLFDRLIVSAHETDVKELRSVIAQVQLSAVSERLLLIKGAESLSEIMQNTLLKLLEEPPSTLVIVIQTKQVNRLKPTVLSRLHQIEVKNSDQQIEASIFNADPKEMFDSLSQLKREALIAKLAVEMLFQRQLALSAPNKQPTNRVIVLDRAIKKLQANTNQKLTLDWLLLHWGAN